MKFESSNCSFSSVATIFWCASLLLVGWFPTLVTGIRIKGHESDEEALLAIKSQINHDPFGVIKSWNRSVALCRWHGITCALRHQRVTKLNLSKKGLRGSLSPYVGNLSFLRFINLQDNNFHGVIPPEIGRLPRLETLILYNNSFGGRIPPNLTHCSNLILFRASLNKLIGNIPVELGKLVKLENLEIAHNNLTGHLPPSLGNVSTLQDINLEGNYLEGGLQVTLGFLKRLAVLKLDTNNFSGFFPPPIFNLSSLRLLSLVDNQLSGSLPVSLGYSLPNLRGIYIAGNYFSGTLPVSLSNASKLQEFDISCNHFSSSVSISFGNAHNLTWLNMESNDLGGGTTDLDFITTMTNCSKLEVISLAANKFSGLLPNSIANLSISLQQLSIGENHITGTIPLGIANLVNLIGIGLAENRLTGTIPESLGMLKKLQTLYLGGNTLTRTIPASVGNLSLLTRMTLEENLLEGSIPAEFGRCQILIMMALGSNKLTGSVPKEIFSIATLSIALDLSDNLLIGSIPSDIGNLVNLVYLNISNNNFSGHIPAALSSCTTLETLSLEENHFDGSIPDSLSSLRSIEELDLSSNNLSGQIPEYLGKLSFLKYLNLSHNRFEGPVSTKGVFNNASAVSLTRNGRLCGGIAELHLPSCPFTHPKDPKTSVPLKLIWIVCGLLKATDGFAPANLIGQGSFGNVYKGILYQNQEQNVIAVKVMNLQVQGASRSFLTECKTLRNVRHRNLVKIISACSSIDFQGNPFKALIYEFIPNGSLHQWLHDTIQHGEPKILNFLQRLNIAIDVALALDYLHHHCEVPVVHCDLKPSNILLDHDMVARVGDFGLARFFPKSMNSLSGTSSSTHCLKGTIGYAPPEYGIATEATTSGDMYSFGILLLEIFTRKRPTDDMFKDGLTLHLFSKMASPDQVLEAVDPLLLPGDNDRQSASSSRNPRRANMEETKMKECLVSILKVGIACSVESPTDRMDIVDAAKELHFIRDKFVGTRTLTERERANHL
ncbi:putative LRR receptor-like serine/threonine-protein kinase [Gossypium australe]|uniref:non-specific serine/threonine protein kinase n=1 Tax=Gossypium australe TaxID=47621 RepID=A0A5B6X745_9ROSI|nr:putative LRR receptor-like serine/threonine-protein kinase [Gossypium australe]